MKKNNYIKTVVFIGAGSWGTAVAKVMAEVNPDYLIKIWAYEKEVAASINEENLNHQYLPGVKLPKNIKATTSFKNITKDCNLYVLATPSKVFYDIFLKLSKILPDDFCLGYLTKGFCRVDDQILTISQTIEKISPSWSDRIVAISGPSHAEEVSKKYHTCLNVASRSWEARNVFTQLLKAPYLDCRSMDDIIGVELGGILKNPIAVAAGMLKVLPNCGDNLAGALMSEALKEMLLFTKCLGGKEETILDISGLGDLVTTALSQHSRNRRFGQDLATHIISQKIKFNFKDRWLLKFRPEAVLEKMTKKWNYLAEGAYAIEPLIEIAQRENIFVPVYQSLYEVLLNKKDPSLLIETIKNPEKFKGIYSSVKIQLGDKNKGLEKIKGQVFKDFIVKETINELKGKDLSARENIISDLKVYRGELVKDSNPFFKKEIKILDKINSSNFEKSLFRLSKLYVNSLVDRYSSLMTKFYFFYLRLHSFFNFFKKSRGKIIIKGDLVNLKSKIKSANLIYLPFYETLLDHLVLSAAIKKAKLPFPRFLIYREALKSTLGGLFLKKAGGFIIDSSRFMNKIYQSVVNKYLMVMIKNGIPVLYSPELVFNLNKGKVDLYNDFFKFLVNSLYDNGVEIVCLPLRVAYLEKKGKPSSSDSHLTGQVKVTFLEPLHLSDYTKDSFNQDEIITKIKNSFS